MKISRQEIEQFLDAITRTSARRTATPLYLDETIDVSRLSPFGKPTELPATVAFCRNAIAFLYLNHLSFIYQDGSFYLFRYWGGGVQASIDRYVSQE